MELVTIAIPIYNGAPYLRDAIHSVLNQSYKEWRLLLIDDGSTDDSLSIMREFEALDARIRVISDGQNRGLVARLNESVALTETKYYARMDADDIMYITRIEEELCFLEAHPEIDVVGTSIMTIDNKNNIVGSDLHQGSVDRFIHPSIMGRSEWFKANPYSDWAVRAEDFELWCRTSTRSRFWALDKPLLFYREFGMVPYKKTMLSLHTILRIARRYRCYERSWWWSAKLATLTVAKMCAYSLFALFGNDEFIVRHRQRKAIPQHRCLTMNDLLKSIADNVKR